MTQQDVLSLLNGLIETCRDGEQGFIKAGQCASAPYLRTLFPSYATDYSNNARELQQCIQMLGGRATTSVPGSTARHRGWMNLVNSTSSNDDLDLLEECGRGEMHIRTRYTQLMKQELTPLIRSMVQRQLDLTVRHHERIRSLRYNARVMA